MVTKSGRVLTEEVIGDGEFLMDEREREEEEGSVGSQPVDMKSISNKKRKTVNTIIMLLVSCQVT